MIENMPSAFPPLSGEFYGIIPEILADIAENIWQQRKELCDPVSKPVALGLAMKNEGIDNLRELLAAYSGITPDMQSVIGELSEDSRDKFTFSLGEVVLGSALEAMEKGVLEWDDKVFVVNFNEAIAGTPLPRIKLVDIRRQQERDGQRLRTSREQTQVIRDFLSEKKGDKTFLSFIERSSHQRELLPQTIYTFIYNLEPLAGEALAKALPVYKDVLLKRLVPPDPDVKVT